MPCRKADIIAVIVGLILISPGLKGQSAGKRYTLDLENRTYREVFDQLEHKSGLSFSYSRRIIDDRASCTIQIENCTMEEILELLFKGQNIRFLFIEEQIVLKRIRKKEISQPLNVSMKEKRRGTSTVSGYVKDAETGEVLIGATLSLGEGKQGATTNNYGFFSITTADHPDSISCSYIGYHTKTSAVPEGDDQIDFRLPERYTAIKEVVIYSGETEDEIKSARSSEQKIRTETVRKMPALFGEKDVIKSLAAIPGIKFFGDGSTIFYVRGGSRDQNLITIDEAPVYNPTHLMGLFSTVVPDAVKDIKVYKGDFPAAYGGRLSSLVDIHTKDGNMHQFGMDASMGLLSSRITLEGPVWKEHISYFISGRRSYILKPLQNMNSSLNDLYFADLHVKLNYRISDKDRIFFSFYNSVDNFEVIENANRMSGVNWKNATSTLRWNHLFGSRLFSNTTLFASQYDYFLNMNLLQGDYWNSHIDIFSLKTDFTWFISPSNTLRFGAKVAEHFINPGNYYDNYSLFPLPYEISTRRSNESNIYLSDQLIISEKLSMRMGLRITGWNSVGPAVEYSYLNRRLDNITDHHAGEVYNTYVTGDPRIGLAYKSLTGGILKLSYSRTSQFEHLITNSISPFTTLEVWLPSGPNIKPQRANQATIGYSKLYSEFGIRAGVEGYYKHMSNQVDYRDHAKLLMNPLIENELRFGEGRAYGIETILEKKQGRLRGWISYTLSKSELTIEDINQGIPYPSYGDRPHDLSLFLSYQLTNRLELSGNFIYMTGAPFTTPTAFYYYENYQVPIYFIRNNDRLPDYHRLDVALNWDLRKKEGRFDHELIFSIYNLYGRKNPVAIHFNKIENPAGQLVVPYNYYQAPELTPTQFYIYQIVPSLSYHFSF